MPSPRPALLAFLVLLGSQDVLPMLAGPFDLHVFGQELQAGFRHIVPEGLDHLAFLAGLFFLSQSLPALLLQTTLFTLAHSFTLGLVVLLGLDVPERWVEVAVGLTLAALALEGFFPERLRRWRGLTVALFGAIHGLAFAHNLRLAGSLQASPLAALFGFNLGVELGQLAVIGALLLAFSRWWDRAWYRPRLAQPALAAVALAGLGWALARW